MSKDAFLQIDSSDITFFVSCFEVTANYVTKITNIFVGGLDWESGNSFVILGRKLNLFLIINYN